MIISVKQLGKRKPPIDDWNYTPPENMLNDGDGGITLRQLITLIVLDEVSAYNERQKKQCFTKILTQQQINDSAKSGKINMGGAEETQFADTESAVAEAIQAYEDGLYLVFLDSIEQTNLDAQVYLSTDSKMTFIKLTFLAGG